MDKEITGGKIEVVTKYSIITVLDQSCHNNLLSIISATTDGFPIISSVHGSCCEVRSNEFQFTKTVTSRVYNITNFCGDRELVAEAFCDATTDGGGWIVIQRRIDGSVDFNRPWVDYEDGFGSLTGEFRYGVRTIHCLTSLGLWELRIDFTFTDGIKSYASYKTFAVESANTKYRLKVSGFEVQQGVNSCSPLVTGPEKTEHMGT
ncbi:fibroleukin-like [Dysidea avara]|uniref:fibroleukin-like n=1 Tax=Dysidea avara TaxID=196820 RepID=UPI003316BB5A